jgi:F-type H+-transporting ATPase subunit delta
MRSTVLGRRYAGALLGLGVHDGNAAAYGDQLAAAASALGMGDVRKAMDSPLYDNEFKQKLVGETAGALHLAPAVANLLRLLLDKRRFGILADIAQSYRDLLDEHTGLVRATVVSAVPLDSAGLARLRVLLQRKVGRRVELTPQTDPSVLGGLRVHVGPKVYDATIASHLARLRETLKHQA